MNGKKARMLRKQAGYQANEVRGSDQYKEARFNKMELNKDGMMVPVVKITRSLEHSSTRAKYQDLKNLYRAVGV